MQEHLKRLAGVIGTVTLVLLAGAGQGRQAVAEAGQDDHELKSTIAFTSTRDFPSATTPAALFSAGEIYLMDPDGTNPRRLTDNTDGDGFAALSPDGKKIVFNSNRNRTADEPLNTADLFVMDTDGSEQTLLIRGSSATWSPDGKFVAFHASASGTGLPIKPDPGAATSDSDIFVINVDDGLEGRVGATNITNSPLAIDDDADWSPDGRTLVYTRHSVFDDPINSVTAEIYAINADGSDEPVRLTSNAEEERAPSWSPDGTRIVFMCRRGGSDFEICVMNADGTGQVQLTDNSTFDGTPTFSPDGGQIVFHRTVLPGPTQQIWLMNADGTAQMQMTSPPGFNTLANWGELRVHSKAQLTDDSVFDGTPALSPGGRKIVPHGKVVPGATQPIRLMNADGADPLPRTYTPRSDTLAGQDGLSLLRGATPTPVCGDGSCDVSESCRECPGDCGSCSCTVDTDCQPASCCNPTSCITIWEPQSCDTSSCGDGCWICLSSCSCQDGVCVANF